MAADAVTPRVTIAVVSWNTRDLLADCLSSLQPDAQSGLIEVCVYDNASDDGSADLVEQRYPWVKLMRGSENLGFGPAVNRVAEQSKAEWLAPANSDIRVAPGAIEAMLDAGRRDVEAGLIAPRLVLPDGSTQGSLGAFQTLSRAFAVFFQLNRLSSRMSVRVNPYRDLESPRRVEWAAGAFVLVRREAFNAVGGFQESQWMYAEDLDLCWRLRAQGWWTRYEPSASVFHEHSAAADQAFGKDGVRERQHEAIWSWSVQRLGRLRTCAVALLEMIEGWARIAASLVLRRGGAHGRSQVAFGLAGLRRAWRRL